MTQKKIEKSLIVSYQHTMPKLINTTFVHAKTLLSKQGITLMPHQRKALKWLDRRESAGLPGSIIADEMGLGKTLEIISLIIGKPKNNTLLIVPASLISQWVSELKKFAPHITPNVHGYADESVENHFIITSYVKASRNYSYRTIKWDRIVIDEAHNIRNPKGIVHINLKKIPRHFTYLLTGTPIHNKFGDIASLFKFIGVKKIPKKEEARLKLVEQYVLRRTLEEVQITLPNLTIETEELTFRHKHEKRIYKRVMNGLMINNYELSILEQYLRLRQAALLPRMISTLFSKNVYQQNTKLDCILENLKKNIGMKKTIVFCYFIREVDYLVKGLEGERVAVIDGRVPMSQRKSICDNEETDVLIINIMAGGTGLNITNYDTVYFTGPHWNPTLEQQAIARVYRIGQSKPVQVKKFIMKGTIEERILFINQHKLQLINTFIKE